MTYQIINDNCLNVLQNKLIKHNIDLAFLDPPFNQNKEYAYHNDNMNEDKYWSMMTDVCKLVFDLTNNGGAIYFMQREKNTEYVLACLRKTGWFLQNLIIWKKKTSAVPVAGKYGKHYQIIAYATKGEKAKTFNRLRIEPPLPPNYKYQRENGVFLTDVWDDIRELTSGYYAGNEAIRKENGERFHKQQTPLALLVRIILSSSKVGDWILDPFAGTGTTLCVSYQLQRNSIGIEIDPINTELMKKRLDVIREEDLIQKYYKDYICTENLSEIWGSECEVQSETKLIQPLMFKS
ncbi:TPA: site-specific DNA-methyltransferase [Candidatus Poribacteria bacterium]|nr:site-specific DNA-methyltransferase [Candidatus Poribacteria bacterium]